MHRLPSVAVYPPSPSVVRPVRCPLVALAFCPLSAGQEPSPCSARAADRCLSGPPHLLAPHSCVLSSLMCAPNRHRPPCADGCPNRQAPRDGHREGIGQREESSGRGQRAYAPEPVIVATTRDCDAVAGNPPAANGTRSAEGSGRQAGFRMPHPRASNMWVHGNRMPPLEPRGPGQLPQLPTDQPANCRASRDLLGVCVVQ